MQLTRFQYRALRLYLRYHTRGFTIGEVLRTNWFQWSALAVTGVVSFVYLVPGEPTAGLLLCGICAGALARDLGHYQVAFRLWPANRQIYDWNKVSDLIELYEKKPDGRPAPLGS